MPYDGRYDNPKFISAFLADMRLSDEELADGLQSIQEPDQEMDHESGTKPQHTSTSRSGTTTPADVSAASSPPAGAGTRAPPPTPETIATLTTHFNHLPPIHEDLPLQNEFSTSAAGMNAGTPNDNQEHHFMTSESVKNYHQDALDKFKKEALARIALRTSVEEKSDGDHCDSISLADANESIRNESTIAPSLTSKKSTRSSENEFPKSNPSGIAGFGDAQDDSTAIFDGSEDSGSSVNIIVDAAKTPELLKPANSPVVISTPTVDSTKNVDPIILIKNTTASSGRYNNLDVPEDESRESAIYFPTWGSPAARKGPPAQVRKIVVSDLPTDADLTLVQSLVHGGAIDEMEISQSAAGFVTANVMFTTGEACKAYNERYPNGLPFKYRGRKHTARIDMDENVNVISGVLQSYLNCGATRVVKVDGADSDWSMKALHKIAGGKGSRRKVEAIIDNYRNESRSIIFRFTKISDAVAFHAQLRRSEEWVDANVQFAADPCEKATGIHQE